MDTSDFPKSYSSYKSITERYDVQIEIIVHFLWLSLHSFDPSPSVFHTSSLIHSLIHSTNT